MNQAERHQFIISRLTKDTYAEVDQLAREMAVSTMTVRRDLDQLDKSGLVARYHGGARLNQGLIGEISYAKKNTQHIQEKKLIARRAAELIEDGDVVFLDSGTTTGEIARLLCVKNRSLTVITNDLNAALILTESSVHLIILGGMVHKDTQSVISHSAEQDLNRYRFSKAYIGTPAIDRKFCIYTPTMDKYYVKRTVLQNSLETYLVADSGKFYGQSLCVVGTLSEFTGVITDKQFSEEESKRLEDMSVRILNV
jgi:DeoR/GlpR family transcriptional regulator of sugar metabolism